MSASFSAHHDGIPHGSPDIDPEVDRVVSSDVVSYSIIAVPAPYASTTDLIIRDTTGRSFMLTSGSAEPVPLPSDEFDVLGMAFEPAQDTSWHTAKQLRRMFFGDQEA
jgi:hypothetical protein